MAKDNLHELMLDELRDVYSAEQQITKALPKMIKAATTPQLKAAFDEHLSVTNRQIGRLERAFELLGEDAKAKTCKGMKGLLTEGEELISEHESSPLLDTVLVGAAQKVEHYEIAAYGTICAMADAMGHTEVSQLLHQTLNEEKQTDDLLTQIGERLNREGAATAHNGSMGSAGKTRR